MVSSGYKKPLTDDKIWDLSLPLRVKKTQKDLYNAWIKSSKHPEKQQVSMASTPSHMDTDNFNVKIAQNGHVEYEMTHASTAHMNQSPTTSSWMTNGNILFALVRSSAVPLAISSFIEFIVICLMFTGPMLLKYVKVLNLYFSFGNILHLSIFNYCFKVKILVEIHDR